MNYNIPIIDFSKCGLRRSEDDITEGDMEACGEELYAALSTEGFAYLSNHGIEWSFVDEIHEVSEVFYSLPLEAKKQFEQKGLVLSYDSLGRSSFNTKDLDYYEGFRSAGEAYHDETVSWPEVCGLKDSYARFAKISSKLILRLMKVLAYGMNLQDRDYLCRAHSLMNQKGNYSIVKTLKYPPIDEDDPASEHRAREHCDRTTITLLFQDQIGGLQIRDVFDNLVDVHPIPGTIVINVGETLEAWSGNKLKATKHKVIAPSDPAKRTQVRRSLAYFAQANNDVIMETLVSEDGTVEDNTCEKPLTVKEYLAYSLSQVFDNFSL